MRGGRTILGGSVEDGQSCPSSRENVPEAGILVASGFDGQDCPSSTHPAVYSPSRAITRRFVCATTAAPLTLRSRCRCAEDGQSWEVQWRTDNPVRPPEKTSPRPAFWWLQDLTDRIVRPPRILPFTALRARSRAGLSAQRPPRHSLFAAGVDARRTDNPGRFSGGRTILSVPPRERPEAGILVDPRFDGQDCPSSTHPCRSTSRGAQEDQKQEGPASRRPLRQVSISAESNGLGSGRHSGRSGGSSS